MSVCGCHGCFDFKYHARRRSDETQLESRQVNNDSNFAQSGPFGPFVCGSQLDSSEWMFGCRSCGFDSSQSQKQHVSNGPSRIVHSKHHYSRPCLCGPCLLDLCKHLVLKFATNWGTSAESFTLKCFDRKSDWIRSTCAPFCIFVIVDRTSQRQSFVSKSFKLVSSLKAYTFLQINIFVSFFET